jgi:hypothetical protein
VEVVVGAPVVQLLHAHLLVLLLLLMMVMSHLALDRK